MDLFTCGDKVDFEVAIDVIAKGIKSAQWIVSSVMNRGIVGNNGVERLVPVIEGRNCRFSLSWEERFLSSRAHALSASIDIYECRAPWIGSSEALRKFALDFAEKLGSSRAASGGLTVRGRIFRLGAAVEGRRPFGPDRPGPQGCLP